MEYFLSKEIVVVLSSHLHSFEYLVNGIVHISKSADGFRKAHYLNNDET
jgi:hypothetical protein